MWRSVGWMPINCARPIRTATDCKVETISRLRTTYVYVLHIEPFFVFVDTRTLVRPNSSILEIQALWSMVSKLRQLLMLLIPQRGMSSTVCVATGRQQYHFVLSPPHIFCVTRIYDGIRRYDNHAFVVFGCHSRTKAKANLACGTQLLGYI